MAEDAPFTKICDALWAMLEANTTLASMVESGNRIKYTSGIYDPRQHQLGPDDLPQVTILYHGLRGNYGSADNTRAPLLQNTSSNNLFHTVWSFETKTRPYRLNELFDMQWEIIRSLMTWESHLPALTWDSNTFVSCIKVMESASEIERVKVEYGITGWKTTVAMLVFVYFGRTAITPS